MKHAFLLGATGMALALFVCSHANAQGSGARPAAQTRPQAPRPAPPPAPNFDVRSALNRGDYAGAYETGYDVQSIAYQYRQAVGVYSNRDEYTPLPSNVPDNASPETMARADILHRTTLPGLNENTSDISNPQANAVLQAMLDASRNYGAAGAIRPPSTALGSRRLSAFEDEQTTAIRQNLGAAQTRMDLANQLLEAAQQTGDAGFVSRAQSFVREASNEVSISQRAINVSEQYRGRAFASEADAAAYLGARGESLTRAIQNTHEGPGRSFDQRAGNFFEEMRQAWVGNGGSANTILSETQGIIREGIARVAADDNVAGRRSLRVENQNAAQIRAYDAAHPRPVLAQTNTIRSAGTAAGQAAANARGGRGSAAPNTRAAAGNAAGRAGTAAGNAAAAAAARTAPERLATGPSDSGNNVARTNVPVPAEDFAPPEPVPTRPGYPTMSAEERARISRQARERREAREQMVAAATAAQRAQLDAAAREAAERAAMVERSRVADENYRIFQDAVRRAAQDGRWRQLVEARFAPNGSIVDRNYAYAVGQSLRVANLEQIYGSSNYADGNAIRSLSAAGSGPSSVGYSLSAAGRSLSSVGWSLSSAGTDWRDPALESLYDAMGYFNYRRRSNPWASGLDGDPARAAQMAYNAGSFDVRFNRDGREGLESGGYLAGSLFDGEDDYLRFLTANGLSGLDALLAQPFNVILTWGAGAFDLDLHMTGPMGEGLAERFHIYFANAGNLEAQPFAKLIKDCICSAGSEVILTSALNRGGVYRVSVFNFGDQSATSTNLANLSNAQIQIVRGGTTQSVGNGTTIIGGRTILTTAVPNGQPGNTWVAVELDPKNGRITVPRAIKQSPGSNGVN